MIKYNTLKYIVEQTSSDLENTVNKLKKLISAYNSSSDEEKDALGSDPNSEDGLQFWNSVERLLQDIQNTEKYSPESSKYIEDRGDDIASSMYEIKQIVKDYPEIYNANFKEILDPIASESLPKSTEQQTGAPSTTSTGEQKPESAATGASEKKPEDTYAKDYTGGSIVDFLNQSGKPSDFESRRKLAVDLKIVSKPEDYEGTASQNTQMLNTLRGGKQYSDGVEVKKAELAKPYTTPKDGKGPTIKYGSMEYPAYIDMGGGKYRLAKQEELDNPNMQLYIPNPKKGQQEYGKPNFVKVRREGSNIRRQSQFGGALGSVSNLFGDIGTSLAKPFRK